MQNANTERFQNFTSEYEVNSLLDFDDFPSSGRIFEWISYLTGNGLELTQIGTNKPVNQFCKFCRIFFLFLNQVFTSFDMFGSSYGIYEVSMVKSHQNDAFPYNFKDLFRLFIFDLNP